jgi:hypothetical protein
MKTSTKITLGMAAIALTGALVYVTRSYNTRKRLLHIANEGYETAHDILYPTQYNRGRKLQYGPVLPADDPSEESY